MAQKVRTLQDFVYYKPRSAYHAASQNCPKVVKSLKQDAQSVRHDLSDSRIISHSVLTAKDKIANCPAFVRLLCLYCSPVTFHEQRKCRVARPMTELSRQKNHPGVGASISSVGNNLGQSSYIHY